jgi:hypothetical protein
MSNRGFFVAWPVRASDIPGVPFRLLSDSVVSGGDVPGFVGVADLELLALPLETVHQLINVNFKKTKLLLLRFHFWAWFRFPQFGC